MNCFQLIRSVLDELYARIEAKSDTERDSLIAKALEDLHYQYSDIPRGLTIDYKNPLVRFAYIFCYVTVHTNIVHEVIGKSKELMALFDEQSLQATCIGGGPGSDFLGILKHATVNSKNPALKCILFDREEGWAESWHDVDDKIGSGLRIMTTFMPLDVTNPSSWSQYTKYLQSDLFTMIYFMSEIYGKEKEAGPYFASLFANAKPGSLFLYVDNNDSRFYGWFDQLAESAGLKVLSKEEGNFQLDFTEEKKDLGEFFKKFGNPRLKANVAIRVCARP